MNESMKNKSKTFETTQEIDLLELAKYLWSKAVIIIVVSIIALAGSLAFTYYFIPAEYESSAVLYVNNLGNKNDSQTISGSNISAAQTLVKSYIEILKQRATLEEIIEESHLTEEDGSELTYKKLLNKIEAASVNSTELFEIAVTGNSPYYTLEVANAIVKVLPDKIASIVEGSSVKVVSEAVVGEKTGPSLLKNGAIGCLAAFVLIVGILTICFLLDKKIHTEEYLLQTYDYPLLAVVPNLREDSSKKYAYKKNGYKYGYYHHEEEEKSESAV